MKLYLINGTYFGTQAEAKPTAADAGIKVSAIGEHEVEVPTDKAGLIAYLNNIAQGNDAHDTIVDECVGPRYTADYASNIVIEPKASVGKSVAALRAEFNTVVDELILECDFPAALRIASAANSRVGEHLKAIADERFPKPAAGYQKSTTLSELLS